MWPEGTPCVMSPNVETSFYTTVQQHHAVCLCGTDVTLNSSPQEASILIILPFSQCSQASVQNTPSKISFHTWKHTDTSQTMTLTGSQKHTDIQQGAFLSRPNKCRHIHTSTCSRDSSLTEAHSVAGSIIIRQHYNNIHIIQAGEFSAESRNISKQGTKKPLFALFLQDRMSNRHPDNESIILNIVECLNQLINRLKWRPQRKHLEQFKTEVSKKYVLCQCATNKRERKWDMCISQIWSHI